VSVLAAALEPLSLPTERHSKPKKLAAASLIRTKYSISASISDRDLITPIWNRLYYIRRRKIAETQNQNRPKKYPKKNGLVCFLCLCNMS